MPGSGCRFDASPSLFQDYWIRTLPQVICRISRKANQHDLGAADRYIGEVYIQRNPNVPNGREAVDIFRVDHGRIVERWDLQQAIPEQAANDNTMF